MYCSECGQPARGKFCSHCGHSLTAEVAPPETPPPPINWEHETSYDSLMRVPVVRERIERQSSLAKKGLTGEQFLALYDKVMPTPVPLEKLAAVVQPFYAKLGMKTGKQRKVRIDAPVGRVMLRTLCSLARHNQTVRRVNQTADGCCFEAVFPSDLFALEGDLLVTVRRQGHGAEVEAATSIPGQWFDWGKSTRALERLVNDLQCDPA